MVDPKNRLSEMCKCFSCQCYFECFSSHSTRNTWPTNTCSSIFGCIICLFSSTNNSTLPSTVTQYFDRREKVRCEIVLFVLLCVCVCVIDKTIAFSHTNCQTVAKHRTNWRHALPSIFDVTFFLCRLTHFDLIAYFPHRLFNGFSIFLFQSFSFIFIVIVRC